MRLESLSLERTAIIGVADGSLSSERDFGITEVDLSTGLENNDWSVSVSKAVKLDCRFRSLLVSCLENDVGR